MKNWNELRVGKVSSVDYETGMMQVVYTDKDNAVTAKVPYANYNNEYCMPKIGEQVLVAHMSNGSSRGVALCTMWNAKNTPPESGKGLYRKELSKVPGAAYVRFEEEKGEYLIRVPVIMLHGVDRTDLEGPEVNIAANIKTSFESPEHTVKIGLIRIAGIEDVDITAEVTNNVKVTMGLADLEALIKKVRLETLEELEVTAKASCQISAEKSMNVKAGSTMNLEDENFKTSLTEIMERLEDLDGNTSARK